MGQCFACPPQETVSMIEQFGKFRRIAYPGLNCVHCYAGESVAGNLSLRVQQLDVTVETKTRDNVFVDLVISVQYQVEREAIYDAFYKLTDTQRQISSYVFDVVRATVPKMDLDDVFFEKEHIAGTIKNELTKSMSTFGYSILQALVNDISPARKVKDAMNEINAATRMRIADVEKAEAQKLTAIKAAEGEAEGKYLSGMGMARQRQAIVNGLRESVREFSEQIAGVRPQDVLELILVTQYFDTLREIGAHGRNSTIFLPHGPGAIQDFSSQIRSGMLQAGLAQEMSRGGGL